MKYQHKSSKRSSIAKTISVATNYAQNSDKTVDKIISRTTNKFTSTTIKPIENIIIINMEYSQNSDKTFGDELVQGFAYDPRTVRWLERKQTHKQPSWQDKLRIKIDEVLPDCKTFEDFIFAMKSVRYKVSTDRKHITFLTDGQKKPNG